MSDPESRAVRWAAVTLLVLSVARWFAERPAREVAPEAAAVPEAHVRASRAAADEAEARARPLEAGERLDPNRASAAELDRLPGVGAATAEALVVARDAGAVFRRLEDLVAVRGIGPATAGRMAPHLDFSRAPPGRSVTTASVRSGDPARVPRGRSPPRGATAGVGSVDVNRADAARLAELPGIGPVIAERIVAARREQPFASVEDLARVHGIGPATVARLKGRAVAGGRVR